MARFLCGRTNPSPRRITIEISDNGIGIEPQFVEKVFYAFEQADSQSEGLGLGLAISKAIVEMHAGTIRAHSDGLGERHNFCDRVAYSRVSPMIYSSLLVINYFRC